MLSMELEDYKPHNLPRMYNMQWIGHIIEDKLNYKQKGFPNKIASRIYRSYQTYELEKKFIYHLRKITRQAPFQSKNSVLQSREDKLLELLDGIKKDYK